MNLNKTYIALAYALLFATTTAFAVPVTTTIDVEAEISTSVRIYVDGKDVTNGNISVKLANLAGYMWGITPKFLFIGNASDVSLNLTEPPENSLVSGENKMMINTSWILDGDDDSIGSTTSAPVNNVPVYPTLANVPASEKGVKLRFISARRAETYPLGKYSGTYTVMVTPSS
ncbi:hypothetical protein FHW31_003703 [Enterobacter asburiae]|uniref:hypothetical protein n=1 Tax=Enterobacter asburiae TaxID=61645 RepID=UPI00141A80F0|nr:hypothetical protein [Enterobacter asburiae]NIH92228.1 hypothetical protein [Enterobacter asburiae]